MKAKKIYEHNAFKQGRDPLDTMGVGLAGIFKESAPELTEYLFDNISIDFGDGIPEFDPNLNAIKLDVVWAAGDDKTLTNHIKFFYEEIKKIKINIEQKKLLNLGVLYVSKYIITMKK